MLKARVAKQLGDFGLEAALDARAGAVLVLVGESGAGKSTVLRLLAGLARPDGGRIELGADLLYDGERGIDLAPEDRPVGWVPQSYTLFPHLSVFENVAFGLRALRLERAHIAGRVATALESFEIVAFARRMPHQLSGGQQQRVALARALVLEPRLLLLDEPFSALDLRTRRSVRAELRLLLAGLGCTTVLVTHSPAEALAFGDEIAVLESGQITQQGSREDLLLRPRSSYVAAFLGVNLVRGTIVERQAGALARVRCGAGELYIPDPGRDGEVSLVIRPSAITLSREHPAGSARNVFHGAIQEIAPEPPLGEVLRVFLATEPPLVAEITRDAADSLGLAPGREVYAAFKATGVTVVE